MYVQFKSKATSEISPFDYFLLFVCAFELTSTHEVIRLSIINLLPLKILVLSLHKCVNILYSF